MLETIFHSHFMKKKTFPQKHTKLLQLVILTENRTYIRIEIVHVRA